MTVYRYETKAGHTRWRVNIPLPAAPDGRKRATTKRGFRTKREAKQWELAHVARIQYEDTGRPAGVLWSGICLARQGCGPHGRNTR